MVARGFKQRHGLDYTELFSPVVKPTTIRIVLSRAITLGWSIRQLDVHNVFLHGVLDEEVFMRQPPVFKDNTQPNHICRLSKAIYGLKHGQRAWHTRLTLVLSKFGFIASTADSFLFIFRSQTVTTYLLIYVVDIIIISSSATTSDKLVDGLRKHFNVKDLDPLHYFMGIEVHTSNSGLRLCQRRYALDILQRANMHKSKPSSTPMSFTEKLSITDGVPL